ncbi:MAG: O-antigen ligase family protein [Gemmatimonadaceae bacterium]
MTALRVTAALLLGAVLTGNLIRVPVFSGGGKSAPLIALDLALGVFVVVGVTEILRRRRLALDPAARWGIAFVAIAALSVLSAGARVGIAPNEMLFAATYLVRWAGYFSLFVLIGALLPASEAPPVAQLLRRCIVAFAAFGILQSIFLPDFALLVHPTDQPYLDWDPQRNRLVSTFLDPNYAGILIVVGLCLWGGRLIAGVAPPWWEGAILGVALVLTLSRGAMLAGLSAAAALSIAYGFSRRLGRAAAIAAVVLLAASPFVLEFGQEFAKFQIDRSALGRLIAWQRNLVLLADYPMLGIGFNTLGFVAPRYGWHIAGVGGFGLDGGLLFIAALTGLAGVTCLTALLVSIARSARHLWRTPDADAEDRAIAFAAFGTVVAVVVHSLFANTIMLPLVLAPCWILWALPRVRRQKSGRLAGPHA